MGSDEFASHGNMKATAFKTKRTMKLPLAHTPVQSCWRAICAKAPGLVRSGLGWDPLPVRKPEPDLSARNDRITAADLWTSSRGTKAGGLPELLPFAGRERMGVIIRFDVFGGREREERREGFNLLCDPPGCVAGFS